MYKFTILQWQAIELMSESAPEWSSVIMRFHFDQNSVTTELFKIDHFQTKLNDLLDCHQFWAQTCGYFIHGFAGGDLIKPSGLYELSDAHPYLIEFCTGYKTVYETDIIAT